MNSRLITIAEVQHTEFHCTSSFSSCFGFRRIPFPASFYPNLSSLLLLHDGAYKSVDHAFLLSLCQRVKGIFCRFDSLGIFTCSTHKLHMCGCRKLFLCSHVRMPKFLSQSRLLFPVDVLNFDRVESQQETITDV